MPRPKITAEQAAEAQGLVRQHGSIQAAARASGIPYGTLHRRFNAVPATPAGIDELRDRVRELETALKSVRASTLDDEYVKRKIIGLRDAEVEAPNWTLRHARKDGNVGVPVTIWSDWHFAETVRSEEVNGVNEYNLNIAHERVRRLVEKTIALLSLWTVHDRPFPGIVVCLAGDLISGGIHEELQATNEKPVMPTLVDLMGVLRWSISKLADEFGHVFLPCVVGNHGRATKKSWFADRVWTSYEWLLYQFLAKAFEGDDRVRFLIGNGADVLFSLHSHRYLLTHGDTLGKGGDGIIGHFGPVIRGTQKRAVRNQAVNQQFDTLLCGHYHSLTMTPRFIVNGSLIGPGAFSHTLAFPFEKPQQALWLSHPERGITISMPVHVDEGNPHKGPPTKWVAWTQ